LVAKDNISSSDIELVDVVVVFVVIRQTQPIIQGIWLNVHVMAILPINIYVANGLHVHGNDVLFQ
jgi:hypothetical protein